VRLACAHPTAQAALGYSLAVSGFPFDRDFGWVATDRLNKVALFLTGGLGPVPSEVVRHRDETEEIEASLLSLPNFTDAKMLTDFRWPSLIWR